MTNKKMNRIDNFFYKNPITGFWVIPVGLALLLVLIIYATTGFAIGVDEHLLFPISVFWMLGLVGFYLLENRYSK